MKPSSKPNDIDLIFEKVADMKRETNEFKKRDMFVDFLGSGALNLIDETKHQQPRKRYLP
mgnify:CR=1 FL=1